MNWAQGHRRAISRAIAATLVTILAAAACADTIHIWKSDMMGYYEGYYFPISVGVRSNPTPTGSYRVKKKVVDYWSKKYDRAMPYAIFFTDAHAIHRGDITTRSHGCIRVNDYTAPWLYYHARTGKTRVVVHP